jgi:hypothetical protein
MFVMDKKINPDLKTAIIYSIDNLYAYTVEIRTGSKSYFVSNKGEPSLFGNMEEARAAALHENVEEAFLALSKTFEEADLTSSSHGQIQDRYDYSRIPLFDER